MNKISLSVPINKLNKWWDFKSHHFKISMKISIISSKHKVKEEIFFFIWCIAIVIFSHNFELTYKFCELSVYSSEKFDLFLSLHFTLLPSQASHLMSLKQRTIKNVSLPNWMGLDHLIVFFFTSSLDQDTKNWFRIFA